jgi:hypothetical protein
MKKEKPNMNELIEKVDIKKDLSTGEIVGYSLIIIACAYFGAHIIIAII